MDGKGLVEEIRAAEIVLPCAELEPTLAFFTARLGFRVALVFPADAPTLAVVSGHGLRLRLVQGAAGSPGVVRLLCRDPSAIADGALELVAPNGTRVELALWSAPVELPPLRPSFVLTRQSDGTWSSGRAGMFYRDLIPGRQGGRFIASQIRIRGGGPVPDYVHYHRVRFQMIYCVAGSVRVVYEDQGPPFELQAGDCVLQPPEIRHRVLECSPGAEVIEVSCPAEHETLADLELELPTPAVRPERSFGGQLFIRHEAARATFAPWRAAGFEARDLGIRAATAGRAEAHVVRVPRGRSVPDAELPFQAHDAELRFCFVTAGAGLLQLAGGAPQTLSAGDAFVVPAGQLYTLRAVNADFERLEVVLISP